MIQMQSRNVVQKKYSILHLLSAIMMVVVGKRSQDSLPRTGKLSLQEVMVKNTF